MSGKFTFIIGIIAVIIIVPVVLFVLNKNKEVEPVFSAEEEIAEFRNDKAITKTYFGTFPCADCTGIDTNLSLTQPDANASEGNFIMSQRYLGKESDAVISKGTWATQRGDKINLDATIISLSFESSGENEFYLQSESDLLEKIEKDGNKVTPEGVYVLTLLE